MSETPVSEESVPTSAMSKLIREVVRKYGTNAVWHAAEVDAEEARRLFSATDAELADFFDAAHDLLLTDGWVQKAMRNGEGRCAMGAICDAVPFHQGDTLRTRFTVVRDQMFDVLIDVLYGKPLRGSRIADWNDQDERTVDDVLDAFRTCAKTLRNKEQE